MSFFRSDIKYTFGKSPSPRDLSVCFFLSKDTNTEMPSVKEKAKAKLVFITRFCNWWTNAFLKKQFSSGFIDSRLAGSWQQQLLRNATGCCCRLFNRFHPNWGFHLIAKGCKELCLQGLRQVPRPTFKSKWVGETDYQGLIFRIRY